MASDDGEGTAGVALCASLIPTPECSSQVEAPTRRMLGLRATAHGVGQHDVEAGSPSRNGCPPARVHFVDRSTVEWGSSSIVEAALQQVSSR